MESKNQDILQHLWKQYNTNLKKCILIYLIFLVNWAWLYWEDRQSKVWGYFGNDWFMHLNCWYLDAWRKEMGTLFRRGNQVLNVEYLAKDVEKSRQSFTLLGKFIVFLANQMGLWVIWMQNDTTKLCVLHSDRACVLTRGEEDFLVSDMTARWIPRRLFFLQWWRKV